MATPAISIIIAVKNSARFLPECLASVAAQTFRDFELLIVDDHSSDETEIIARSFPGARFLQQDGKGFAGAWNSGIRASRGRYLSFLDSDDRWLPGKLAAQAAMLEGDPHIDVAIGKVRFFVEPGETPPAGFRDRVLGKDHVAEMPGVLMARRAVFDRVGMWGEDWQIASDIDWFLKLKDAGLKAGVVQELLLEKRVHGGNLSYRTASDQVYPHEVLKLLHQSMLRKRSGKA